MSDSLQPHVLYSPWNSPDQNTGVGSLSLLKGTFLTQESNPGLPHCRRILYQLSHKGSPRILEWVAYPFSRDLPNPGIEPGSPALQADSLPTELSGSKLQTNSVLLAYTAFLGTIHFLRIINLFNPHSYITRYPQRIGVTYVRTHCYMSS